MKKYLLLILTMLSVSIGAWADATVYNFGTGSSATIDGTSITINVNTAGDYATWVNSLGGETTPTLTTVQKCTTVTFTGTLNNDDFGNLGDITSNCTYDLTGITIAEGSEFNATNVSFAPADTKVFTVLLPSSVPVTNNFLNNAYSGITAINVSGTNADVYIRYAQFSTEKLATCPAGIKSVVIYSGGAGNTGYYGKDGMALIENTDLQKLKPSNFGSSASTVESIDLSHIRSWAESDYNNNFTPTGWKIVVNPIGKVSASGELSAADFAYLKGLNAEYYNFSKVITSSFSTLTLATGLSLSMKGITLPEGYTLTDADKADLQNNYGDLTYIYSPTSDNEATVPNRVYVVQQGGLVDAFTNEYQFRNATWIKLGSRISLTSEDLDFSSYASTIKPEHFTVLDLSNTIIDPSTVSNFYVHQSAFRVILPDSWSADQMTQFHTVGTWGSHLAALYSYSGTVLNVLGINDGNYLNTALSSAKIVRTAPTYSATTEVRFVKGTYNNTTQGVFGTNMLTAVNNAASGAGSTITSVTVSSGMSVPAICTFDNDNLTSINLTGVNNSSAAVNTTGCASLKFLLLNNATLSSVEANNSTLESVGLSKVNIGGNVSLQGAKLTSFTASGTINGDIDLSYNNSLSEINISNVNFNSTLGDASGDLIVTRKKGDTNITDATTQAEAWALVYGGGTDSDTDITYAKLIGNIKTSTTFGSGNGSTGYIYPYLEATPKAPYSEDVAGYEKDGCALTITLDGSTTNYTTLAAALTYIGEQEGAISNVCNLTINTTGSYELSSADITSINGLAFTSIAETDVTMYRDATLNLDGATLYANNLVSSLASSTIKNIILPRGLEKNVVKASFFTGMTNADFNGALSTNAEHTQVVAYVKKAGSLRTIMEQVPAFRPNVYQYCQSINLPNVTLSGNLLASDIATGYNHLEGKEGEIGNYAATPEVNATTLYIAAFENVNTLRNLDISDAVFVDARNTDNVKCDNMTLSQLGWSDIVSLQMPTSERMTDVPALFLENCQKIPYLCIPYNYERIGNQAFYLAGTYWITTTDSNGAEIDNGINTYTFSKNLKEIGTDPGEDTNRFPVYPANPVFGAVTSGQISDVYILRNGYEDGSFNPTKCYRGSFASGMTYGWGGFDGGNLYCREKYKNGAFLFTILHYPDLASLPSSNQNDTNYGAMEAAYTDVTKQYTKKDQTGALDANGDLIPWPTFSELGRAYNQAIRRLIWADWSPVYGKTPDGNILGGTINFDPTTLPDGVTNAASQTRFPLEYVGWHEFVLSKATYVAPDENVKNNVIYREYEEPQYYTFCVPFDMTPEEVLNLLGVPASTSKIKTKVGTFSPTSPETDEVNETDLYPQIYTLKSVTRTLGNNTANSVQLTLSKNLAKANSDGAYTYWTPTSITTTAGTGSYESNIINYGEGLTALGSEVMIRGGYPYLIKAYLPKGASVERGQLGKYVLSRYAFSMDASTAVRLRDNCYIALQGKTYPSYFAKPYDKHLVRSAYVENTNTHAGTTADNGYATGENIENYYYRFMGQYWDQYMPTNTYYLYHSDHKWYYNGSYDDWDWLPYTCIINACTGSNYLPDDDTEAGSVIPVSTVDDTEGHSVFTENLKLLYSTTDALDDELFPGSSARQYSFVFDDGDIVEVGESGSETTAIDRLDGVDIIPANSKVYNMNGQLVGNTLNGLSKGMYIVNGRKVVIK